MIAKQNLAQAFKNAFAGIVYCIRYERNMRIHVLAAVGVWSLAWWLDFDRYELAVLSLTVASVLAAEMVNTVVEVIVDMISPEFHPMAKIAKDVAAGVVLIFAVSSVVVGYLLFCGKIWG